MPLGTMLTDLLHELLNKGPNPAGNQEFVFCHYPGGSATHEILRGLPQAGGEQNKPCVGRRCANLATGFHAADPRHPQVHEDDLGLNSRHILTAASPDGASATSHALWSRR